MDFNGLNITMTIIWFVALIVFLGAEAATTSLVSIWFALGTLAALLISIVAKDLIVVQILVFVIVSAITLYFTRPLALKYVNNSTKKTNADRVLDMVGVVKETIDNLEGAGAVYVGGKIWSARSENGDIIPVDTLVVTSRIEGVKLIVTEKKSPEHATL